jgi:SAM-dependent methyltransferase
MSKLEHDSAVAELREQVSTYNKAWYRSCSDLLTVKQISNLRCLDLCCGNGEFAQILRDKHKMDVVCADYIPYHLNKAREDGFETILLDVDADAEKVDRIASSHSQQFDLVVNLAAIEHVYNSDNLLRFAHTVLKPNGLFLINTPNIAFLSYRIYSLIAGNRPAGEGHHIRFWDFRFLRTNLFLNGFSVIHDARKFYALPEDAMLRAFKNRKWLASGISRLFHVCSLLQHIPLLRGLCCDELTILARKEDLPIIPGFELNTVRRTLDNCQSKDVRKKVIERLYKAKKQGWLDEHLYLAQLVDELISEG